MARMRACCAAKRCRKRYTEEVASCPKINLQIRTSNEAVVAFYAAIGYGNDNVVSMGKRLEHDS